MNRLKKILSAVLSAIICCSSVVSASAVTYIERDIVVDDSFRTVRFAGDINKDGKVNENDIIDFFKYFNYEEIKNDLRSATNTSAKNYILSEYTETLDLDLENADFDGSGNVDVDDVYYFINQFDIYHNGLGDVDLDGKITYKDADFISAYLIGVSKLSDGAYNPMFLRKENGTINPNAVKSTILADINEDGIVNIVDANYIFNLSRKTDGYTDPNVSWITNQMIEKDKELQEHPKFVNVIPDKNQLTNGFYVSSDGVANRPYFYNGPGPFYSTDKYGALFTHDSKRILLNGYDTNKNNSKQNNIIVSVSWFGYEVGAHEYGSDNYPRVSLLDGNYSGSYNNVFFFCKNVDCIKGTGFRYGKNFFAPNAGCYDPAISPNTTVQRESVSYMIDSTFEHFVFPKSYTYLNTFQKSTGLKSFTDIFAPGVVRINKYCFKASQLNKIIIPARIQDISKQAFYVEKVTKKLNEFCDNNKKSYNIVFLSKSMPYDKDYYNNLDDTSSGHLCISVWPFKESILISGNHRTTADANINVFSFESSGVAQDLNWFYAESKRAKRHHKDTTNTTDYIYKPIYL